MIHQAAALKFGTMLTKIFYLCSGGQQLPPGLRYTYMNYIVGVEIFMSSDSTQSWLLGSQFDSESFFDSKRFLIQKDF